MTLLNDELKQLLPLFHEISLWVWDEFIEQLLYVRMRCFQCSAYQEARIPNSFWLKEESLVSWGFWTAYQALRIDAGSDRNSY